MLNKKIIIGSLVIKVMSKLRNFANISIKSIKLFSTSEIISYFYKSTDNNKVSKICLLVDHIIE